MREENFRWAEVEAWVVRPHADSRYTAAQQTHDAERDVWAHGVQYACHVNPYSMWVVWRGMVYSCGPFTRVEPMPRGWRHNPEFHWSAYGRAVHHFH